MTKTIQAALLALGCALSTAASAQEPTTLRVADYLPVNHQVFVYGLKPFFDEVKSRLGERVKFDYYPAEQLGKAPDLLANLQNGVVNMAIVMPSYTADKMPRTSLAELPGLFTDSCSGTASILKAVRGNGVLSGEFRSNRIHPLIAFMYQPADLLSSGKKIQEAADWSGFKARTAGGPTEIAVRALGGVPVKMAPPELYTAMARGTVDGALLVATSAHTYSLDTISKSVTTGFSLGSISSFYAINDATWQALPADLRTVLDESGEKASLALCHALDRLEGEDLATMEKRGIAILRLTDAQRAAWSAKIGAVAKAWAPRVRMTEEQAQTVYDALAAK